MINIAKLLKNAKEGIELYSPICGHCKLSSILHDDNIRVIAHDVPFRFDKYGRFCSADDAECLLFPGEYCRTWEGWEAPVESGFKSRDWVVRKDGKPFCGGNYAEQITLIGVDANGKHMFLSSSTWVNEDEDVIRLWTIQDAKDGDVLVTEDYIFIFKCILHGGVHLYCHYDIDDEQFDADISDAVIGNIHDKGAHFQPATKEEREQLFRKMKEAGYTWDEKKKELKKIPVKPKFKVGKWITDGTCKVKITAINNTCYWYSKNCIIREIESIDKKYHLWTIQDAKDGDVLVCCSDVKGHHFEEAGIFKQYVGQHGGCSNTFLAHTGIDWDGNIIINGYMGSTNILPATKEQRDLLFKRIKENGYTWDADKKELRKIQPHYDISYFMPKQWVLVRDCDNQVWGLSRFSHRDMGCFICINREDFRQCIPFEGNERLLGTTDMCDERFINW